MASEQLFQDQVYNQLKHCPDCGHNCVTPDGCMYCRAEKGQLALVSETVIHPNGRITKHHERWEWIH